MLFGISSSGVFAHHIRLITVSTKIVFCNESYLYFFVLYMYTIQHRQFYPYATFVNYLCIFTLRYIFMQFYIFQCAIIHCCYQYVFLHSVLFMYIVYIYLCISYCMSINYVSIPAFWIVFVNYICQTVLVSKHFCIYRKSTRHGSQ